mmetsp:Transcript_6362/g.9527  ORF Transcript_6362/g.9527 Transcript_6362/m.9527 type:complete len:237 (-) Transcript_6362:1098-1808(-)
MFSMSDPLKVLWIDWSKIPTEVAIETAVSSASPVIIQRRVLHICISATAPFAPFRGGSIMPKSPQNAISPSSHPIPTATILRPLPPNTLAASIARFFFSSEKKHFCPSLNKVYLHLPITTSTVPLTTVITSFERVLSFLHLTSMYFRSLLKGTSLTRSYKCLGSEIPNFEAATKSASSVGFPCFEFFCGLLSVSKTSNSLRFWSVFGLHSSPDALFHLMEALLHKHAASNSLFRTK